MRPDGDAPWEPMPPRRVNEVRRRARRIMERDGVGYGRAMREAGWQVRRAGGDR